MNLLAIETATENCSVALRLGDETTWLSEEIPNGHSRKVHSMIRQLTEERNVQLSQLDGIAVDIGPGSFTGVRIGIGIAQGLAFASGLPVVGLSSLATLAQPLKNRLVLSAIDARMGQVYWCLYDTRQRVIELRRPSVTNPDDVLKQVLSAEEHYNQSDLPVYGVGSGWEAYGDLMPTHLGSNRVVISKAIYPEAKDLIALAEFDTLKNPALLSAAYVRNDVAKKTVNQ